MFLANFDDGVYENKEQALRLNAEPPYVRNCAYFFSSTEPPPQALVSGIHVSSSYPYLKNCTGLFISRFLRFYEKKFRLVELPEIRIPRPDPSDYKSFRHC